MTPRSNREVQPEEKRFRYAYVLKPGQFDFSSLKPYCERIVYATDGYADHIDNIREQIEESFSGFDADKDVVIPVGTAIAVFLSGSILQRRLAESGKKTWDSYAMGIYLEGTYHFWRVPLRPQEESYEILLD